MSGDETAVADAIEALLRAQPHLEVVRDGDAVLARTALGRAERVVVAGHIDTVPVVGQRARPARGARARATTRTAATCCGAAARPT